MLPKKLKLIHYKISLKTKSVLLNISEIQYNKGFNVHIQSKLLYRTIVMGTSSDMGQPFCPRQKNSL